MRYAALWWLIFLFNLLDFCLTYYAITRLGLMEMNFIMNAMTRRTNLNMAFAGMLVIKLVGQVTMLFLPQWCLVALLIFFILVVGWNLYQIAKWRNR